MYRKGEKGWVKHFDFIFFDALSLQLAFIVSYYLRHGFGSHPYEFILYRNMALFLVFAHITVVFFLNSFKNVLKRGYYAELRATFKNVMILQFCSALYLVTIKDAEVYSRAVLFTTGLIYFIVSYVFRILWKKRLKKKMEQGGKRSLVILTFAENAAGIIDNIKSHNHKFFLIKGLIILDKNMVGEMIDGVPVVADKESATQYIGREWIDEVFVFLPNLEDCPEAIMDYIVEAGITIHYNLSLKGKNYGNKQLVEKMCGYTVLTTSINVALSNQLFIKRTLDIIGGLVGCLITVIIYIFIAPVIYLSSPGPIFFNQKRVGRNGKLFNMYKFRSMYPDAEERKKELMNQNKLSSNLMFKMDFDPRIIGNKILPNGNKKTGIGHFIRRYSIDEFPQFFNVLKGDMSLVGTRPPTIEEYENYEAHHKSRLAIKPGITGLWQVSGRSEITDFEEVVKLDREYILDWNVGKDLRILAETVLVVVKGRGGM